MSVVESETNTEHCFPFKLAKRQSVTRVFVWISLIKIQLYLFNFRVKNSSHKNTCAIFFHRYTEGEVMSYPENIMRLLNISSEFFSQLKMIQEVFSKDKKKNDVYTKHQFQASLQLYLIVLWTLSCD